MRYGRWHRQSLRRLPLLQSCLPAPGSRSDALQHCCGKPHKVHDQVRFVATARKDPTASRSEPAEIYVSGVFDRKPRWCSARRRTASTEQQDQRVIDPRPHVALMLTETRAAGMASPHDRLGLHPAHRSTCRQPGERAGHRTREQRRAGAGASLVAAPTSEQRQPASNAGSNEGGERRGRRSWDSHRGWPSGRVISRHCCGLMARSPWRGIFGRR